MVYHLHITRREFWSYTASGLDITADEWRAVVDADPDLTWRPERGPHAAEWKGPTTAAEPFLDLEHGNVIAKNPDHRLIDKMVSISEILKAKVQGLDGELYGACGAPLPKEPKMLEKIAGFLMPRRRR
ncbi:MAG: hypothetical protein PHU25_20690 [Deltaproteobacteria bacterium]|nr:hypothetical protein [Deltaproteobacteria bacterium]